MSVPRVAHNIRATMANLTPAVVDVVHWSSPKIEVHRLSLHRGGRTNRQLLRFDLNGHPSGCFAAHSRAGANRRLGLESFFPDQAGSCLA